LAGLAGLLSDSMLDRLVARNLGLTVRPGEPVEPATTGRPHAHATASSVGAPPAMPAGDRAV